jgi:hypothetical protein
MPKSDNYVILAIFESLNFEKLQIKNSKILTLTLSHLPVKL